MDRIRRIFAWIVASAILYGCGGSGPEAELPLDISREKPGSADPITKPAEEEQVDYQGFTVAPPPGPEEGNPKQSFDEKLATMVESTDVPSTLAGAFFYLGRTYLSGREPLTSIEASAFEIFDQASSETLQALDRTLRRIDELPEEDMAALYGADFIAPNGGFALTGERLGNAMIDEIKRRASAAEYGDPDVPLDEERAGLVRQGQCPSLDTSDGFTSGVCPNICGVKTEAMGEAPAVRTGSFVPDLRFDDYEPRELERKQIGDCRGEAVGVGDNTVCLRLPTVRPDEIVRLEGFNFHDVDAEVQLVPWLGGVSESQLLPSMNAEAHVRGATVSALERARWDTIGSGGGIGEVITGINQGSEQPTRSSGPPADCTAGDVIHFKVPSEIRPGIYKVRLVMKHPTATSDFREFVVSNMGVEPFIQVVSPASTRFSVTAESLVAANYDREWGREEIGLKFYLLSDGELGMEDFELGGVENFDHRCVGATNDAGECSPATLFAGAPGAGVAFGIVGLEIDHRDAYKKQIRDWDELYSMVTKDIYGSIAKYVGEGVGAAVTYFTGSKTAGKMVGKALTAGILTGVTLWAPADLIIADHDAFSFAELDALTSPLAPMPRPYAYNAVDEIDVLVEPCANRVDRLFQAECLGEAKGPGVYREIREYDAGFPDRCRTAGQCPSNEWTGSLHWLNLRYDRIY